MTIETTQTNKENTFSIYNVSGQETLNGKIKDFELEPDDVKSLTELLAFISMFLFINISKVLNYNSEINYEVKKKVVEFILNDTKPETFNVYNDLPISLNTGYPTLFRLFSKIPQEGGKNLYILEADQPVDVVKLEYQKNFPDKKIEISIISFVQVVSVK